MTVALASAYGSAIGGPRGLLRVAHIERGQLGIRVTSVHPGLIDTPMVAHLGVQHGPGGHPGAPLRSEEHTSELQSRGHLVCRLLLEKKKQHNPRWPGRTRRAARHRGSQTTPAFARAQ